LGSGDENLTSEIHQHLRGIFYEISFRQVNLLRYQNLLFTRRREGKESSVSEWHLLELSKSEREKMYKERLLYLITMRNLFQWDLWGFSVCGRVVRVYFAEACSHTAIRG
jgi:hypothetical protein